MKRMLSLLLAALMCLAGVAALADDNFNATGYPIAKEPVTYTVLTASNTQYADDFNNYTTIKYLAELTNIQFEWAYISQTDWETQINLRLAGADIPDLIYYPLTSTQLQQYGVEGGMFLNYADYIDEYMPNMKRAFENNPDMRSLVTMMDGGIYSLPKKVWTYTMAGPIYYRGDMMEEMGATVPATVDELYDLLVKAKEFYKDVEGFWPMITNVGYLNNCLFPAFGDAWQYGYGDNGNGKVTYNLVGDQMRHYLEFVHKLYADGLIDPEMYTMDGSTINAKVKGGQCLMIGGVGTQLSADHYKSGKVETKVLPPLTSQYSDEMKVVDIPWLSNAGYVINVKCKNPEYLLRYLDMFFTTIPEMENNVCGITSWLGVHGTDWGISEDGKNYFRIVPEGTGMSEEEYKNKYVISSTYLGLVVLDLMPVNNPTQEMKAGESAAHYYPYMKYRLLDGNFKYTDEESSILSGLETDINTYVTTAAAQFINGTQELNDNTWKQYTDTINSMQLDEVLRLKQVGYDRWLGK